MNWIGFHKKNVNLRPVIRKKQSANKFGKLLVYHKTKYARISNTAVYGVVKNDLQNVFSDKKRLAKNTRGYYWVKSYSVELM